MRRGARWQVRLGARADADILEIVRWTAERFGLAQARKYGSVLAVALEALASGPDVRGSRARDEVRPGLRTFRIGRGHARGSHVIVFKASDDSGRRAIDVLRVLHEAMDLPSQVATDSAEER